MSSCFLGVPHSLHSVRVPGHSAHFVSCQEFQHRRQCEGKFAICAILETVCPAHKYSDWHSVWKWVYPGCRGGKKKHAQRKSNLKHACSCISSLDKYLQLRNLKNNNKKPNPPHHIPCKDSSYKCSQKENTFSMNSTVEKQVRYPFGCS